MANRERCRQHKRKYYEAHKQKVKAESVAYKRQTAALATAIKRESGCRLCGEREVVCLDFHHRDADEKDFTIGTASARGYARAKILEEIAKCVVICSNCHRKLHAGIVTLAGVV